MPKQKLKMSSMPVVNTYAAGIDVGSRTHYVATGQEAGQVRSFGVYQADLLKLSRWLKEERVITVAMESTGSYWKGLFQQLQADGFEVILVNGKHTRNVKGKKTDVLDCQWIQRLHSLGLLSGSFLPDDATDVLRQYVRQREHLIDYGSAYIKKMQQALRLMNIRLDVALSDITGLSGRTVIKAILGGERNPEILASLVDRRVKKSKEEIALSLQGNWREEYLFELKMSYELYEVFKQKERECEACIERLLDDYIRKVVAETNPNQNSKETVRKAQKKKNKNAPQMDLQSKCILLTHGINLYQIEGVSDSAVLTLLSETGLDLRKFPTAKHFSSWLALSPNNKKSGNRVISSHIAHHKNRLAKALRMAANAVGHCKEGRLAQFFKRIAYKYGRKAAITATARKLAVIIWNMLTKHQPYRYEDSAIYTEKIRRLQLKNIQRKINALNISDGELNLLPPQTKMVPK